MHGIAVQLIVIQRLAVIGNKHFQVVVQRAGGVFQNIAAHAGNVAHNERLPAEGADIHADFDGLHILFSGIALISAAAIGGIAAQGPAAQKQHAVSALGKIEAEFLHGIRLHYFSASTARTLWLLMKWRLHSTTRSLPLSFSRSEKFCAAV